MKEVSVTELRQNLQAFLAKANGGQTVRVTSRGQVIAELIPPRAEKHNVEQARKRLRGSVIKFNQPTAPAFSPEEWEMNR